LKTEEISKLPQTGDKALCMLSVQAGSFTGCRRSKILRHSGKAKRHGAGSRASLVATMLLDKLVVSFGQPSTDTLGAGALETR